MAPRISCSRAVALLARLAVLVPRPRVNLVLYYGVLAPRAAWRVAVVPRPSPAVAELPKTDTGPGEGRGWPGRPDAARGCDRRAGVPRLRRATPPRGRARRVGGQTAVTGSVCTTIRHALEPVPLRGEAGVRARANPRCPKGKGVCPKGRS